MPIQPTNEFVSWTQLSSQEESPLERLDGQDMLRYVASQVPMFKSWGVSELGGPESHMQDFHMFKYFHTSI